MTTDIVTIKTNENGLLVPQNIEDAYRLAKFYVASGLLPDRFKTPESVLTAMQFAIELGLKPLTAMRQIAVVKGTPCMYGDLPLSLVKASGLIESFKEYYVDGNGRPISSQNGNLTSPAIAAVAITKRKGEPDTHESFFSMDDARNAGLLNSPTWKSYPKRMLRYRARSALLKDIYPDAINGMPIAEYDFNTAAEEIEATPIHAAQGTTPPQQKTGLTDRLRSLAKEEVIDVSTKEYETNIINTEDGEA